MPRATKKKRGPFLTVTEAAEEMGVSPRTMRNRIYEGFFNGQVQWTRANETGWWRVRTDEFMTWLQKNPSRSKT